MLKKILSLVNNFIYHLRCGADKIVIISKGEKITIDPKETLIMFRVNKLYIGAKHVKAAIKYKDIISIDGIYKNNEEKEERKNYED